jgi:hypothetical protein
MRAYLTFKILLESKLTAVLTGRLMSAQARFSKKSDAGDNSVFLSFPLNLKPLKTSFKDARKMYVPLIFFGSILHSFGRIGRYNSSLQAETGGQLLNGRVSIGRARLLEKLLC